MPKISEVLRSIAGGGIFSRKLRKEGGKFLFGKPAQNKQLSTLSPEQNQLMELIQQGLTTGEGPLKDLFGGFDEQAFNKGVAEPALKHFRERILPQVQESYIANNQVGGSSEQQAKLDAATDLQDRLAQLMYQAQQGQQQNRLTGLQTALGRQSTENLHTPRQQGAVPSFLQGLTSSAGRAAGTAIAG